MFLNWKVNFYFKRILGRPDINKAYAMVGPEDSWYKTITTVHEALAEIRQLPHEHLSVISHDGLKMEGIYYSCGSKKTMIWVHGYTSHAERESAYPGLFYRNLGFNVLIPYLRAHGPSEGKYLSFGAMEHRDMQCWVDKINDLIPGGQILIHGISMGGGIALDLATVQMQNVKCLVIDAPSESVEGFLRGTALHIFKDKADKIYPYIHRRFMKMFSADPGDFNRILTLRKGKYPILLSAGSMENCEELFSQLLQANPQPTHTVILPGCNHGNGMYKQTQMYQDAIREFVERYMEN